MTRAGACNFLKSPGRGYPYYATCLNESRRALMASCAIFKPFMWVFSRATTFSSSHISSLSSKRFAVRAFGNVLAVFAV
jgi:hypothetical protein